MTSSFRRPLFTLIVLTQLVLAGCSVFEPVGSFFSQGYRNTVAYFNAYYNAQRLFNDAEAEIIAADRLRVRSGRTGATQPVAIPPSAKTKLTSVIDKCSNILAFHAQSNVVDDALMLIGRSYAYMGEHVKAERKFSELLSQYPSSDLSLEAETRLGVTLYDQGRVDESRQLLEPLVEKAHASGDTRIEALVLERLARISRDQGNLQQSIGYYSLLRSVSGQEEVAATALLEQAGVLLSEGKSADALELVNGIDEVSDDPFYQYQAGLLASSALTDMQRFEDAIRRLDLLMSDFRNRDRLGWIQLEKARVLKDSGDFPSAITQYRIVDTTYARQELGSRAAYELAELYEIQLLEYGEARKSYDRATLVTSAPFAVDARKRSQSMLRFFTLRDRLRLVDSLRSVVPPSNSDSSSTDSLQRRSDSLAVLHAVTTQDLGEWYYAESNLRDSAIVWLLKGMATQRVHSGTARCLFILADIAVTDSIGRLEVPKAYLERIIKEFPSSVYAGAARIRLGIAPADSSDPALDLYTRGERNLMNGAYESAVTTFESIPTGFPNSYLAGKGVFAAAWVYEYHLGLADSALVRYRDVMVKYPQSPLAAEARKRYEVLSAKKERVE